jgi:hypothetical protein
MNAQTGLDGPDCLYSEPRDRCVTKPPLNLIWKDSGTLELLSITLPEISDTRVQTGNRHFTVVWML